MVERIDTKKMLEDMFVANIPKLTLINLFILTKEILIMKQKILSLHANVCLYLNNMNFLEYINVLLITTMIRHIVYATFVCMFYLC